MSDVATSVSQMVGKDVTKEEIAGMAGNGFQVDNETIKSNTDDPHGKLTEMQEMLMRVVLGLGGVASFEEIFESVMEVHLFYAKLQKYKNKRQWGSDSKRALLASLSHNPPGTVEFS